MAGRNQVFVYKACIFYIEPSAVKVSTLRMAALDTTMKAIGRKAQIVDIRPYQNIYDQELASVEPSHYLILMIVSAPGGSLTAIWPDLPSHHAQSLIAKRYVLLDLGSSV